MEDDAQDAANQFARAAESFGALLNEMAAAQLAEPQLAEPELSDASGEPSSAAAAEESAESADYDPFDVDGAMSDEHADNADDQDEMYDEEAEVAHYKRAQSAAEQAPWHQPPLAKSEIVKQHYTPEQIDDLRNESAAAALMGLHWRSRGPPGEVGKEWRGQKWRPGSERWGNNGGVNREWWSQFYKAKRCGKEKEFLRTHPKPTSKGGASSSSSSTTPVMSKGLTSKGKSKTGSSAAAAAAPVAVKGKNKTKSSIDKGSGGKGRGGKDADRARPWHRHHN